MKKITLYILLFLSVIILSSADLKCKKDDLNDLMYIVNNSDKDIYWIGSGRYPDTTIIGTGFKYNSGQYTVSAHSKITMFNADYGVNRVFDPQYFPSGIYQLFIFDADKIRNTPEALIKKNEFVLKRFQLTKDSLYKLDRTFVYP